jgi:arsenate reductase-like glutaredoxin family protein
MRVKEAYDAAGVEYVFIDILRVQPSAEQLRRLVERYGPEGVVRGRKREASEAYRARGLEGLLKLIRSDPRILVRPIVVRDGEVFAGEEARALAAKRG